MSNKDRVYIGVFIRGESSVGLNTRHSGATLARYDWAILVLPKNLTPESTAGFRFDVTNGRRAGNGGRTDLNPNRDWWYRCRQPANPLNDHHFICALMIGKLPQGTTAEQVRRQLTEVSLPRKDQRSDQNSVFWTASAISKLQKARCADGVGIDSTMNNAARLSDEILARGQPREAKDRLRNATNRKM